MELIDAFQVLARNATMDDVRDAAMHLFTNSDEYHLLQPPFEPSEVLGVANAIIDYILDPELLDRNIDFNAVRPLIGSSIEYNEYASMFSEDMLFQNYSTDFGSLEVADLRRALMEFLVAIMFRYRFCVYEDRAAFPVSVLLDYMDAVTLLFAREKRHGELSDALWRTLRALRSLEPHGGIRAGSPGTRLS